MTKFDIRSALLPYTKIEKYTEETQHKIDAILQQNKPVLIGICGETAAGKTTLMEQLQKDYSSISVLNADNYFCDISDKMKKYGSFTKLVESGYETEAPENFQMDLLAKQLRQIKDGSPVMTPEYSYPDGVSKPYRKLFWAKPIIFVEGICTLYEQVRDLFDVKIYLSVDKSIQWERYQKRAKDRGQDAFQIEKQFQIISKAAAKYMLPNKKYADILIEANPISTNTQCVSHRRTQIPTTAKEKEYGN